MILRETIQFVSFRKENGGFTGICLNHNILVFGWDTKELVENAKTCCSLHFERPVDVQFQLKENMILKINEAIALQNARQEIKNKESGRPLHTGKMKKSNLGRIIFPNDNNPKYPLKRMTDLSKGYVKLIRPEWISTIVQYTGVDANFLFALPSKHDKDFEKLCNN